MDFDKLDLIDKVMFDRFNFGEPEKADIKTVLRVLAIRQFYPFLHEMCNFMTGEELVETLRTFADGIELAIKESEK